MSMSLKAFAPQDWIEIDDQFVKYLSQKDTLLKTRHAEVFASLPGTAASQQEVLELLLNHLLKRFPQHYRRHGHGQTICLPCVPMCILCECLKISPRWRRVYWIATILPPV